MSVRTEEDRAEIARRFEQREPLDAIAADFGTTKAVISNIALKRGCKPRHLYRRVQLAVKLRPNVFDELRRVAEKQRTSPEVLAREAIAAYLGADQ